MRPADGEPPQDGGGAPTGAEERRRIAAALAAAAEGLADDAVPEALCRACVRLLPVSGASVTLSGGPDVQSTWCASGPTAARLAETQFTLGDGPGRTALERAAPVLAADLTDGPDVRRWPVFAHQALDRLRARAFAEGRTLTQLAHDLTTRKLPLAPPPDEPPTEADPPDDDTP
ncbi:hypothetical protein ACF1AO_27370 [Streptomyces longwoodensis]|uniref:hypothetical protein n=1 Tax=Streptomyces longwoodensis TaxID=68231 RepID=UPI0036FACB28